jgi:hypothetical protein
MYRLTQRIASRLVSRYSRRRLMGAGACVPAQAVRARGVQRIVRRPISAAVKPVPVGATGAGGNRGDAALMHVRGFLDEALRVGN